MNNESYIKYIVYYFIIVKKKKKKKRKINHQKSLHYFLSPYIYYTIYNKNRFVLDKSQFLFFSTSIPSNGGNLSFRPLVKQIRFEGTNFSDGRVPRKLVRNNHFFSYTFAPDDREDIERQWFTRPIVRLRARGRKGERGVSGLFSLDGRDIIFQTVRNERIHLSRPRERPQTRLHKPATFTWNIAYCSTLTR